MNSDDVQPLSSLLQRSRNSLWRGRARRTLWYGLCLGSLIVTGAGLVHVWHRGQEFLCWLPVALLGPLLAVVYALWWQRPGYTAVAAALDRAGRDDEFFTSAWEALNTPSERRSAGERAVIQRSAAMAASTAVAAGWGRLSPLQRRCAWLPWTLLLVGGFLWQLPAPVSERDTFIPGAAVDTALVEPVGFTGDQPAGYDRARNSGGLNAEQAVPEPLHADQVLVQPLTEPGEASDDIAHATAQPQHDTIHSADINPSTSSGEHPLAGGSDGSGSGTAATDAASLSADSTVEALRSEQPVPPQGVEYVDIARSVDSARVAGLSALELTDQGEEASRDSLLSRPGQRSPRLDLPARQSNFSLSQGMQISRYFEHIEGLP